jgi:hypothetical protein
MLDNFFAAQFRHCGFDCVVGRGGPIYKNYNGYLRLPQTHPWIWSLLQSGNTSTASIFCSVHGGITYFERELPNRSEIVYRTYPEPPLEPCENELNSYWLGFDTCHSGDKIIHSFEYIFESLESRHLPAPYLSFNPLVAGVFRDVDYVKWELIRLAEQAHNAFINQLDYNINFA